MAEWLNPTVDVTVGCAIQRLYDERPVDVAEAAIKAGIGAADLELVFLGARRVSAEEMFVLVQRLGIPAAFFFEAPAATPAPCTKH